MDDDGSGIPSALRDRVLDPFFTTKINGTRLGLATVADIVRQRGGGLRLGDAAQRRGLRVEVRLPKHGSTVCAGRAMIAIYSGERAWRQQVEQALQQCEVVTRTASRPAELAKCLSDGRVRVVVAGPRATEVSEALRSAGTVPVVGMEPDEPIERMVLRAVQSLP